MKVIVVIAVLATQFIEFNEAAVLSNKFLGAKVNETHYKRMILQHDELLFASQQKVGGQRHVNVLTNVHKTAYWGTVQVGTPAQEFSVIFDTGSGNLILPEESCDSMGCNAHKKYSLLASSTGKKHITEKGYDYTTITFGTGEISGYFHTDRFCIAEGLCTNVNFIASEKQSASPFSSTPFDGILGLGLPDLSLDAGFNILDDLKGADMLPYGTFAVFLTDDEKDSEITFGGYRAEHIASDVVWAKVTKAHYWQVFVDDITFNNEETGLCPNGCQVAVDTGTSMMAGPSDMVASLRAKLGAASDCANFGKLPDIGFRLGDKVLNLSPDDYMDNSGGWSCSFSLMDMDIPPPKGPLFVFGDPFLRRFVTIYDKHGPRVGFAVANHPGMDETKAAKIISDVKGKAAATGGVHKNPVAKKSMIPVELTGGFMGLQESSQNLVSVKLNRVVGEF